MTINGELILATIGLSIVANMAFHWIKDRTGRMLLEDINKKQDKFTDCFEALKENNIRQEGLLKRIVDEMIWLRKNNGG